MKYLRLTDELEQYLLVHNKYSFLEHFVIITRCKFCEHFDSVHFYCEHHKENKELIDFCSDAKRKK